jgi:hypothetical protein
LLELALGHAGFDIHHVRDFTAVKKIAILQSSYIPWKGYFDMIAAVDEFILYDDMQYTRRDWRNRNRIKTPQGAQWLTVPVNVKDKYHQRIRDVEIADPEWATTHWKSLSQNYRRARCYVEISDWLEPVYLREQFVSLSNLNRRLIEAVCQYLGIHTKISSSWDYSLEDGKTERLAELCRQAGGSEYVSGPAAKDYIDQSVFRNRNIKLSWFDYNGYAEYPQLWGDFIHDVTVLDLLFNCGKDAPSLMRYVKR